MVRGGVDIEDHLCSGFRFILIRAFFNPDVLAYAEAEFDSLELDDFGLSSLFKIAFFIENGVIGEVILVIDPCDLSVIDESAGVIDVFAIEVNKADVCSYAFGGFGDLLEGGDIIGDELGFKDQVFRGVAGYCEFGNTTSSAPCLRALSMKAMIFLVLPSMSPTVGLI